MNINATIFIQAFNFYIAYLLFRFVLLKPAWTAICEEEKEKEALENLVMQDKRACEQRQQEIQDQWKSAASFFKKHMPTPIDTVQLCRGLSPKLQLQPLDQAALDETKKQVSSAIVSAIKDLHGSR